VGVGAATGVGVDRLVSDGTGYSTDKEEPMTDDAARFGDPRLPAETITSQSHLFPLGAQPPTTLDGGSYQQANEDNFPILKGQEASILLLTLQPGGIREPSSTGTVTTRASINMSARSCSRPRVRFITSRTVARQT
jgi:oxalate decarboxylase